MAVGLDIGSKFIKLVQLEKKGDVFSLVGTGMIPYRGSPIWDLVEDADFVSISQQVRKLFSDTKISSKVVNISIPESKAFTRTLKYPLLTDQEVSQAVKWEAEQHIPIPIAEAVFEHQIIERNLKSTPPEVTVLLVAAPEAIVEKYIKVLSLINISVAFVETELLAMARSLATDKTTKMLVDLGSRSTDIAVIREGNVFFTRSIETGGEALTRSLSQGLSVEGIRAEEYKKTYGLGSAGLEGKIAKAMSPVFNIIVDEIKRTMDYYKNETKSEMPSSIIISGGGSKLSDVVNVLSKALQIEISMASPFANIEMDPQTKKMVEEYSPFYSVSVGLAMREE